MSVSFVVVVCGGDVFRFDESFADENNCEDDPDDSEGVCYGAAECGPVSGDSYLF